jgi:2-methylcitrate dehydratase PrpD
MKPSRLGQKDALTTEEAQYSTSFPCALALVHGTVMSEHVVDETLSDPEAQRLSAVLSMDQDDYANRLFPHQHMARAEVLLHSGGILKTG